LINLTDASKKMGYQIETPAILVAHPNAHLWDNGKDPVNELKNVMKFEQKRYRIWRKQHSKAPMAMLKMYSFPFIYFIATK
jgi:hypothetical protein